MYEIILNMDTDLLLICPQRVNMSTSSHEYLSLGDKYLLQCYITFAKFKLGYLKIYHFKN